eukprot:464448_1
MSKTISIERDNEWRSVDLHDLNVNFGLSMQWTQIGSTVYFILTKYASLLSFNLDPNNVNFKQISQNYDVMGFEDYDNAEISQPCLVSNETHLFMHFNYTISY